jgi:hypothetical protein
MKISKTLFSLPIALWLVIAMALLTGSASAQIQFLSGFTTGGLASLGETGNIGYEFQTGSTALTVADLGVLENTSAGLTESHQVGIWQVEASGPDLLVGSATVGANGTNTGPADAFGPGFGSTASNAASMVYEAVTTPFTLAANTDYVIGAYYADSADATSYLTSDYNPIYNSSIGTQLVFAGPSGSSFAEPSISTGSGTAFLGPDFIATVDSSPSEVPEPSTYALLGAGLLFFFLNCRRLGSRQPQYF